MADEDFGQLLNDPNHPDRPNHPDFWAMSEVVLGLDGMVAETPDDDLEETFLRKVEPIIDLDSVTYMAQQRTMRAARHLGLQINEDTIPLLSVMTALYTEGAIVGRASGIKEGQA